MKKRILLVFALVVVLAMIATAPVTAKGPKHDRLPPSGDQVLVLNVEDPTDPTSLPGYYGCEDITWFGTIEIDGKTFGMALYGDPDYDGPLDYGEGWRIFTGKFKVGDKGMLEGCAPGQVVMEGYDEGIWDFATGEFQSDGDVLDATGYFERWADGYKVRQSGTTGPGVSVAGVVDAFGFDDGTFEVYAAARERPIKGTVMGEHGPPDDDAPGCPEWAEWRYSSAGEGRMSHLGRVEYSLTQCTVGDGPLSTSKGTITFVAANGDELWVRHTMSSELIFGPTPGPPDGFLFEGEWTAVGGTGRFTNSTGSGDLYGAGNIYGVVDPDVPEGLMQINIEGNIAYDRSGKKRR